MAMRITVITGLSGETDLKLGWVIRRGENIPAGRKRGAPRALTVFSILIIIAAAALMAAYQAGLLSRDTTLSGTALVSSAACNGTVYLKAELKDAGGTRVPDALVLFKADGKDLDSLYTDRNGMAELDVPVQRAWCGHPVDFTMAFSGDGALKASSDSLSAAVRTPTALALAVPSYSLEGQNVTAEATLINAISGEPVPGKTVSLDSLSVATDGNGTASFVFSFQEPGEGGLTASFGGDAYFEPSRSQEEKITIEPLTCDDGTLVGGCSGSYMCLASRNLAFDCESCGCGQGLMCISGECITEGQRVELLVAGLQRSNVKITSDEGIGSGVIIGKNGSDTVILTNRHVVDTGFTGIANRNLQVISFKEEVAKPVLVLIAPEELDLALVVVKKDVGPAVEVDYDSTPRIGAEVLVLGSPLGIPNSVTKGIVSNFVTTNTSTGFDYNATQTDAAVNPGNSGGGVFLSSSGHLIGVTSFKLLITKGQLAEGLGFAIPVSLLREFPPEEWTALR
jgi:hypothetical protein